MFPMTKEQMNAYKMRITQAGIGEFCVIMFEMEIQWIEEALSAYETDNREVFVSCVTKAQSVQVELMNIMNVENDAGYDVYSIFAFINKELIRAKLKGQPLELARCKGMLEKLHHSFIEVAKTDDGGALIKGSEKVYAGLTYGATGLVESSVGGTQYSV